MKKSDKIFLVGLGVIGLGGILLFGGKLLLKEQDSSPNQETKTFEVQEKSTATISTNDIIETNITYTTAGFSPKEIKVEEKDSCVFSLLNQSDKPLLIRLSPHSEKD